MSSHLTVQAYRSAGRKNNLQKSRTYVDLLCVNWSGNSLLDVQAIGLLAVDGPGRCPGITRWMKLPRMEAISSLAARWEICISCLLADAQHLVQTAGRPAGRPHIAVVLHGCTNVLAASWTRSPSPICFDGRRNCQQSGASALCLSHVTVIQLWPLPAC